MPIPMPKTENVAQKMFMWEGYEKLVRSGLKQQTIRLNDPFTVGPVEIMFEKEVGETVILCAQIIEVRHKMCTELSEIDAVKDGFATLAELRQALEKHYPHISTTDVVDIVTFLLV